MTSSPIKAVVFDWAGTMIDFGCLAPVKALVAAFAQEGVALSADDARRDMGRAKRDHVAALLAYPNVARAWTNAHGAAPIEADGDRLYRALEPLMLAAAADHCDLIPGAAALAAHLTAEGIKIGSCTGYTRAMMAPILAPAAAQGYAPQSLVCAGETPSGRPSPQMLWRALIELDAWPPWTCIKVDDAEVGIAEGRNAGCWTIGVAASGNAVGLGLAEYRALPEADRQARTQAAAASLRTAGAHYVVDTVAEMGPALAAIARAIDEGQRA